MDHSPPSWDESPEWFVTICTTRPKRNTLCFPERSKQLISSFAQYHRKGTCFVEVMVLMPDHLHVIMNVPSKTTLSEVIRSWKRWSAKELRIEWQRGFFEHRLRSYPSAIQKFKYILNNPVSEGFVKSPDDRPYKFMGTVAEHGRLGITAPTYGKSLGRVRYP
jgi:putative transposase